jgi:hypothetical protein
VGQQESGVRNYLSGGCALIFSIFVSAATACAQEADTEAQPASPADAQAPVGTAGRTVYPADYFRPFSPANALEVIRRVPGFTLDIGAQDVRGFGGAAGNVVINGARPSSKNDTLETILARIPAQRVLRVEVGSGDQFGAEFAGRAQVANLVLSEAGGLAGNIDVELRRIWTGDLDPQGSVSALLRRGPSTFNLSLGYNNRHNFEEGSDTLTSLPSGALFEFRRKTNDIHDRQGFVSGSWALDNGENRTANLNGRFATGEFELNQTNDLFPAAGQIRDDRLSQFYKREEWEIGGDITRPVLGGALKLVGLATRRTRENADVSFNRVTSQVIGGFEQFVNDVRDERVVRLVWSSSVPNGWTVEMGAEGAYNSLDSDVQLFAIDEGGARRRIDLPIDQALVEEYRGETFINAGRSLAPNLRFDAGLTFEGSRLTVSGDTAAERQLRFFKPRLVLDWRPFGKLRTQLALTRTVAQLDFYDFISAAELSNDRVSGGNANLLPQRAWEVLATIEQPILGDGLAKLELAYQAIEQVQDRVPTPEGFDAPGNLGSGTLMFARATLDAPLNRFGIKGGRLTVNSTIRDSSVEDPYTGRNRFFSNFREWELEARFRQDLGEFAWGISYFGSPRLYFFRRDEIDVPNGLEPYTQLFAEYRPTRQTTLTLLFDNLFQVAGTRDRTFYKPDRTNPNPFLFEFRERNSHTAVSLRLRHSFGG